VSTPGTGALRLVRGAGLTALAVALAGIAHVVAGGRAPAPVLLVALGLLLLPAGVGCARRRVRPVAAAVLLGATQVVVHHVLAAASGSVPGSTSPGTASLGTASPGTAAAFACQGLEAVGAGHHAAALHCAPPGTGRTRATLVMLAAHALAVVVTALVVAGADRALWWAVELWGRVRCVVPTPRVLVVGRRAGHAAAHPARPSLHLRVPPRRRGPPRRVLPLATS